VLTLLRWFRKGQSQRASERSLQKAGFVPLETLVLFTVCRFKLARKSELEWIDGDGPMDKARTPRSMSAMPTGEHAELVGHLEPLIKAIGERRDIGQTRSASNWHGIALLY
jgi:hypothetical protein